MHSQTAPDSLLLRVWGQDYVSDSLHAEVGFESGTETSNGITPRSFQFFNSSNPATD